MFKHKNEVRILNIRTSLFKSIFDTLFAILCTTYVISKHSFDYNLITELNTFRRFKSPYSRFTVVCC